VSGKMDLKSIAEAYQSIQEGKVNAGLQAYLDKKKGKKENGEEKEEKNGNESKGSKPDFLDLDKDGDKKEPMKKAAKEKNMKKEEVQQMDEFVGAALGALNTANKVVNVAKGVSAMVNTMKKKKDDDEKVAEHHQKDANGKVIEHDDTDTTPSSVEEDKTVLSKLTENGEELDMFDAVVAYLIDEGFAETLEEAQKIMSGLKPELVEEVYQNQLKKISK
tara:strand:+ start:184 stop:840 length:657 start_codon:yes stop_codon:yes gene_type:complete